MRAVALLGWWQLRNTFRSALTDPRRLVPLLVIIAALGVQIVSVVMLGRAGAQHSVPVVADLVRTHPSGVRAIVFTVLVLVSASILESGLTGGALTFGLPDISYLFPAPVSRRVVLMYRIPSVVMANVFQSAGILYVGYVVLWRLAEPPGGAPGSGAALFLATAAWMCGYTCIAMALEMVFGTARAALARTALWVFLVAMACAVGATWWRGGIDALPALEGFWLLRAAFYPCHVLTGAMVSTVTGEAAPGAAPWLLGFFALCLAALLSRRDNYYEATLAGSERVARIREAARLGNVAAVFSQRMHGAAKPSRMPARGYAIRPFGRGAGALVWAHLAAAAKRPGVNFLLPFASGLAMSAAALVWHPGVAPVAMLCADAYVACFLLTLSTRAVFRQCVARRSLMRPLPIRVRPFVLAEVVPVAFTGSLFGWGAAIPMLVYGGKWAMLAGGLLALISPLGTLCVALIQYTVTLWYPSTEDHLQQLIGTFVSMALVAALAAGLAPFIAVPLLLRAASWVAIASGVVAGSIAVFVLWLLAVSVYRRVEIA